ncbi:MAG: VOC family protein [Myxococcota bacterium]|nr:VOC family protein [Myxococcota bacterium]
MDKQPLFHLAFPVSDLDATKKFYENVLQCRRGREADTWVDFDFFGHQISAHLKPGACAASPTNPVDGDGVPVRHFGCILTMAQWHAVRDRIAAAGIEFLIEPKIRFNGEVGEQATFFVLDPSGNGLEFKAFGHRDHIFQST